MANAGDQLSSVATNLTAYVLKANNLSDLPNPAAARANLGVGSYLSIAKWGPN